MQTVVFCLVDIYIMLGKAFLPYLEGLNSTQLRLVTIYANRISQARTGTPIDATQWWWNGFGCGCVYAVFGWLLWLFKLFLFPFLVGVCVYICVRSARNVWPSYCNSFDLHCTHWVGELWRLVFWCVETTWCNFFCAYNGKNHFFLLITLQSLGMANI